MFSQAHIIGMLQEFSKRHLGLLKSECVMQANILVKKINVFSPSQIKGAIFHLIELADNVESQKDEKYAELRSKALVARDGPKRQAEAMLATKRAVANVADMGEWM